ncbi:hypothetical protein ABZP36_006662 [Zizania latifolia]
MDGEGSRGGGGLSAFALFGGQAGTGAAWIGAGERQRREARSRGGTPRGGRDERGGYVWTNQRIPFGSDQHPQFSPRVPAPLLPIHITLETTPPPRLLPHPARTPASPSRLPLPLNPAPPLASCLRDGSPVPRVPSRVHLVVLQGFPSVTASTSGSELPSPFPDLDVLLSASELREAAYEILVASSRTTG